MGNAPVFWTNRVSKKTCSCNLLVIVPFCFLRSDTCTKTPNHCWLSERLHCSSSPTKHQHRSRKSR
eukprot:3915598-Amphidinium_carterae.1